MEYIHALDFKILELIQRSLGSQFMDKLMPAVTSLGNAGIIWVFIGVVLLASKKSRRIGATMLISLVLCLIIGNLALKPLVARLRPFAINEDIKLLIPPPQDFSFPSGHTMSSFAGATVLYKHYHKTGIAALIMAALISFSRLYLYVHFPSDVLVGLVIGVLLGLVSVTLSNKIIEYKPKKPR